MRDMEPIRDPEILARAQDAFDLCQTMEDLMRQNLRRRFPQASEDEVEQRFTAWVEKRQYVEPPSKSKK
jgi:Rv0078B-related antitoxin